MNEKDLNIKYICKKTMLDKQDELVPIILEMIKESYKAGLNQAEYDNTMGVIEENAKLKKHLEIPKTCNLKTLEDYKSYYEDCIKEQILEDTYIDYCAYVNLAHRYSELKKQLEELKIHNPNYTPVVTLKKTIKHLYNEQKQLLNQQKEFIKYLEDEIKRLEKDHIYEPLQRMAIAAHKYDLSKYKEIIGGVEDEK